MTIYEMTKESRIKVIKKFLPELSEQAVIIIWSFVAETRWREKEKALKQAAAEREALNANPE